MTTIPKSLLIANIALILTCVILLVLLFTDRPHSHLEVNEQFSEEVKELKSQISALKLVDIDTDEKLSSFFGGAAIPEQAISVEQSELTTELVDEITDEEVIDSKLIEQYQVDAEVFIEKLAGEEQRAAKLFKKLTNIKAPSTAAEDG